MKSKSLPADLSAAQTRFEKWRAAGRPRRPLPPELWRLAADLVRAHGVYRVARVLRLEYYKVREQAEGRRLATPSRAQVPPPSRQAAPAPRPRAPRPKPAFVQVVPPAAFPAPHEVVVELADAKGRHMSIRSRVALDVVALVNTFCGGAP
jgi:hypothetical protein